MLCRALRFSIPQPQISGMDIQAAFERACWRLGGFSCNNPLLDRAQLHRKKRAQTTYKTLLKSINKLKERDEIVIIRPGKGWGVVVMDKSDYIRLLCETLISDQTKFTPVGFERSPTRRLPKYYHPQVYSRKKNTSYQMSKESFPRK